MNKKGSLLFCAFHGCPQELDFKTGWRKACHSKGKFYGTLKHNCGTLSGEVTCKYISRALAIEHKFKFVDKDSEEGKKLQKETGWHRTDFVWVPEDTTIRPIRGDVGTKRGLEHVSDINTDQETERVSKKQAIDRDTHTESDELWADQLRSAACCLLGAYDGLEAQSILNQLVHEPDAVLANSDLNTCFCSLCRTSMTVMAYNVPGATVSPDTLCCSHCRSKGMIVIEWPNIIHGFCASQRVDPATLLRGLTREALKDGFTRPAVEAEADKALAERDPVAAAVNLFDRGTYFQCNFEPDTAVESAPCQVLMSVKAARPGSQVCEAARGLTDTSRTGLLMLGKAGLGTKFHVDRTQAENVAFSVVDKPKGKSKATRHGSQPHFVLARWWFVHPHVAPKFAEFVRDSLHHADGLQDFMPKPEHWELMLAFGSMNAIDGRDVVVVLNQGPGDIVLVPPGWPHAVNNVMPCCKLAWDHYDPRHLATYAAVHRDVASPLFRGGTVGDDYMAVGPTVSQGIEQAC
ncbi:hypothetical protein ABBQ32_006889 [Trebouxia sp. C0010 RCD-2024]